MLSKSDLVSWLSRMASDVTENGAIERYDLLHSVTGAGAERIDTFPANENPVEDLAEILDKTAKHDASSRLGGTPERYVVVAFREGDQDAFSQYGFLVEPSPGRFNGGIGDPTEPANQAGLTGQLMRHNEVHAKLLAGQSGILLSQYADELATERRRRLEAEEERDEFVRRAREASGPVNVLAGLLTSILPVLVAQFMQPTGTAPGTAAVGPGPVPPGALGPKPTDSVEFEALLKLVEELSPPELQGCAMKVSEVHQLAFFELYKGLTEKTANREMLKVAAGNLLSELSPEELSGILETLTEGHAQIFLAIYKGLKAK